MGKIIIDDVWLATEAYLPLAAFTGFISGITFIFLYAGCSVLLHKKIKLIKPLKVLVLFFLYLYIFMILSIAILSREPGSRKQISLIPFSTLNPNMCDNAYVIENILLFLPMGFLLPLLIGKKFKSAGLYLLIGLTGSILIEFIQLITQRGYFQTDDIIMNFVGTWIGYYIQKFTNKYFNRYLKHIKKSF